MFKLVHPPQTGSTLTLLVSDDSEDFSLKFGIWGTLETWITQNRLNGAILF